MATIVYIHTLPKRYIPFAFLQMAIGRRQARNIPGVTFAKLMGTGTGKTFTPSDSNLCQWAILVVANNLDVIESSSFIRAWEKRAINTQKLELNLVSSHG